MPAPPPMAQPPLPRAARGLAQTARGECPLLSPPCPQGCADAVSLPAAVVAPLLSPYTKYSSMINQATPYVYPVPVRDDGNMPDIPSHPCDKEGPNLDWLKNL
ncbi:hypothetical protein KIL84_001765 [Mauremys mutica]|uniref:NADH dehydrogenase [ubiquinone] 1 alpha subcomplex subunit 3 n=1 Tax=Mauremys mutica TaxID=74926 RepID=A0A9D3XJR5_9SAUR|nr:hypothetical protein KIL84_001765 [Mauremys mutica]